MSNKKLLKNLLATASMVSVLAGGVTEASAGMFRTLTADNADFAAGNDIGAGAGVADDVAWNFTDSTKKGGVLVTDSKTGIAVNLNDATFALRVTGKDADLNFAGGKNYHIHAVTGANTANFKVLDNGAKLNFGGGHSYTATEAGAVAIVANDFSKLGAVSLNNKAGVVVTINSGVTPLLMTGAGTKFTGGSNTTVFNVTGDVTLGGGAGAFLDNALSFNISGADSNVTFDANAKSTTFTIVDGGTVNVNAGKVLDGKLTATKGGKLVLGGLASKVTADVGTDVAKLTSVEVKGNGAVVGGALFTNELNLNGANSAVIIAGGNIGKISTDTIDNGSVTLTDNTIFGNVGAKDKGLFSLVLQEDKGYTVNGNIYAKTILANNADTNLILADKVELHGDLVAVAGANGLITIARVAENTVTGNIGDIAGNRWGLITFDRNGTLNIGGNVNVDAINMDANSEVVLNFTNKDQDVTFKVANALNNRALIINAESSKHVTISGAAIGAANAPITSISAASASELHFVNDVFVKKLDAKTIMLDGAATYMFGSVTKGVTIKANANITFAKDTVLNGFNTIDLNSKTITFEGIKLVGGQIIGSNGKLTFTGNSTYNSTQDGVLAEVTANCGANNAITFASDIKATTFNIALDSKAVIQATLIAKVIGVGPSSILQLSKSSSIFGDVEMNTGEILVDASASTKIDGNLDNADVTLGGKGAALEVTGTTANTVTFVTLATNSDSIILGNNYTLDAKNIGAEDKMFKSVTIKNGSTLDLNKNVAFVTNLFTDKDNTGVITNVGDKLYGVGAESSKFSSVTLDANATIKGDIYSTDLARGANNITIEDGKSVIVGTSTGAGEISFAGNGGFAGTFGDAGAKVALFSFTFDDAVVKGQGAVYATDVNQGKNTLMLTGDLEFNSTNAAIFVDGSSINTLHNHLKYNLANFGPATTNLSFTLTDDKSGNVTVGIANVDANATVDVKVFDNRSVANIRKSGATNVITITGTDAANAANAQNILSATKIFVSGNRFASAATKFAVSNDANVVTAGIVNEVDLQVAEDMKKLTAKGSALQLAAAFDNSTGDLDNVLDSIKSLNDASYTNAVERMSDSAAVVSNAGLEVASSAMNQIANRSSAVAAGDAGVNIGAWVEGLVGQGEQKLRKSQAGFKSNTSGVTVGADTELNDASIVGIAGTFAGTDVKMKDYLDGDKSKVSSYMVSLYGSYNFADNYVLQGSGSFGKNTIKNTNKRITNSGTVNAKSKFDGNAFGAKALVGYNYKIADMGAIMPMAGLEYARFNAGDATETGAGVQNRTVKVKASDKLTGILGAKVSSNIDLGDYALTPEVHVFGGYDFKGATSKATIKFVDTTSDIKVSGAKAARTSINVGTSITAKYDNMEYGIGYDAKISEKYFGQQGSLKVRVNF